MAEPKVNITTGDGRQVTLAQQQFFDRYEGYVRVNDGAKVDMYDSKGKKVQVALGDARDKYRAGYRYQAPVQKPKTAPASSSQNSGNAQQEQTIAQKANSAVQGRFGSSPKSEEPNTATQHDTVVTPQFQAPTVSTTTQPKTTAQSGWSMPQTQKGGSALQQAMNNMARKPVTGDMSVFDPNKAVNTRGTTFGGDGAYSSLEESLRRNGKTKIRGNNYNTPWRKTNLDVSREGAEKLQQSLKENAKGRSNQTVAIGENGMPEVQSRYYVNKQAEKNAEKLTESVVNPLVDKIQKDIEDSVDDDVFNFGKLTAGQAAESVSANMLQGTIWGAGAGGFIGGGLTAPVGGEGALPGTVVGGALGALAGLATSPFALHDRAISEQMSPDLIQDKTLQTWSDDDPNKAWKIAQYQKQIKKYQEALVGEYDNYGNMIKPGAIATGVDKDGNIIWRQDLLEYARRSGRTPEDYVDNVVLPKIGQSVQARYEQNMGAAYRINGFGDLVTSALRNATFGLNRIATQSKASRQRSQQAYAEATQKAVADEWKSVAEEKNNDSLTDKIAKEWHSSVDNGGIYHAGLGARLGATVIGTASDVLAFKTYGKIAEGVAPAVTNLIGKFAPFMAKFTGKEAGLAESFLQTNLGALPKYVRNVVAGLPESTLNLGGYMGTSGALGVVAYDDKDSLGDVALGGLKGVGEGVKFAGVMALSGNLVNLASMQMKSAVARGTMRGVGHIAEIGSMIGIDWLNEGDDFEFTNSLENAVGLKLGLYLSGGIKQDLAGISGAYKGMKGVASERTGMDASQIGMKKTLQKGWQYLFADTSPKRWKLNATDKETINDLLGEQGLTIFDIAKIIDSGGAGDAQAKQKFMALFDPTKMPWDIRQKLGMGMFGDVSIKRPIFDHTQINSGRVNFYSKEGELIRSSKFSNTEELQDMIHRERVSRDYDIFMGNYANVRNIDKMSEATLQDAKDSYLWAHEGVAPEDIEEGGKYYDDFNDWVHSERYDASYRFLWEAANEVTGQIFNDDIIKKIANEDPLKWDEDTWKIVNRASELMKADLDTISDGEEHTDVSTDHGINSSDKDDLTDQNATGDALNDIVERLNANKKAVAEAEKKAKALIDSKSLPINAIDEVYVQELVRNANITTDEAQVLLDYIHAENNYNNSLAEHQAYVQHTGAKINESADMWFAGIQHESGNAVVVVGKDNKQYYLRDGVISEDGKSVSSDTDMVIAVDVESGEVTYLHPDDITQILGIQDKATTVAPRIKAMQEDITRRFPNLMLNKETGDFEERTSQPNTAGGEGSTVANGGEQGGENSQGGGQQQQSALDRIPKDEKGKALYEQATPKDTYDALVEKHGGDKERAHKTISKMVEATKATMEKAQKAVEKGAKVSDDIEAMMEEENKLQEAYDQAKARHEYWKKVANEPQRRRLEEQESQAEARRRADEEARKQAEEEARIKAEEEANKVPDTVNDTPEAARIRGYKMVNGVRVDRQQETHGILGKIARVIFGRGEGNVKEGQMKLVDISEIQESHKGDGPNPLHFIPEAQPKDRSSEASKVAATRNAMPENFDPSQVTGDGVVYTDSNPVVNERGEVIQGNGRIMMMRDVYANKQSAEMYKQYLRDHAEEFGLKAEDIDKMEHPVLVTELKVDDAEAIRLGQMTNSDLESGGTERIKPENTIKKMGDKFDNFINILMNGDEEDSVAQLIDKNGIDVLKWMNKLGFITDTQLESAIKDGKLTPEGKNDLTNMLKQRLFENAPQTLRTQFDELPAKAQKAILANYLRDLRVPKEAMLIDDVRQAIQAFHDLMQNKDFADATKYEDAKRAIDNWLREQNFLESIQNSEKYSTFALELAARFKTASQKGMSKIFDDYYQLVGDKRVQSRDMFDESADEEVLTKAEAIKRLFNIDIEKDDSKLQGGDDVAGNDKSGTERQRGGTGDASGREQSESGETGADRRGGTGSDGEEGKSEVGEGETEKEKALKEQAIEKEATNFKEKNPLTEEEIDQFAKDEKTADKAKDYLRGDHTDEGRKAYQEILDTKKVAEENEAKAGESEIGNNDEAEHSNDTEDTTTDPLDDGDLPFKERTAGTKPLTIDELEGLGYNQFMATQIKSAINKLEKGEDLTSMEQALYIKALQDVRNTRQNGATDSTDADQSQLAGGDNDTSEQGNGEEREKGKSVDNQATGDGRQGTENSEGSISSTTGEGSDSKVQGGESSVDTGTSRGSKSNGSSRTGRTGGNVRGGRGNRESGSIPTKDERAKIDSSIEANKKKAKEALAKLLAGKKKKGSDGKLMMDVTGGIATWLYKQGENVDWEAFGTFSQAIVDLGHDYIKRGVYDFKEWAKRIKDDFLDDLKAVFDWTDEDVDDYINEMWNSQYEIDGESHTMGEWASILGNEAIREEVKRDRKETRKKQKEADKIAVKVGDRDNIDDTLPFLLKEQRDDVMKAETQFFDKSHQDELHGNGKGYLFTNGTGTGKTYTGLGIVKRFVKQGKGRVLIVTPTQEKVRDWKEDGFNLDLDITDLDTAGKAAGVSATKAKGEGVVITTYANMRANKALLEDAFDLIVYDESHRLMENKEGTESSTTRAHHMLANRDLDTAFARVTANEPLWIREEELLKEQKHLEDIKARSDWDAEYYDAIAKLDDINKELEEIHKEQQKVKPDLIRKAQESVGKTKVVFLSATPFNTRESLDYAEGYLFKYKPNEGEQNRDRQKTDFLVENFPSAYERRNGKASENITDEDDLTKEEIAFADKLMANGVMSGRTINNGWDYSRDFPNASVRVASQFNAAVDEVMSGKNKPLVGYFPFDDYDQMSVIYETMKAGAVIPRIKEHLKLGRKIVVFHRRVNDRKGYAAPPFATGLLNAEMAARALMASKNGEDQKMAQEIFAAIKEFKAKYAEVLKWEQSIDYSMPRVQLEREFGSHKYTDEERRDADYAINTFCGAYDQYIKGTATEATVKESAKHLASELFSEAEAVGCVEELRPIREENESDASYKKRMNAYNKFAQTALDEIKKRFQERVDAGELERQRYDDGRLIRKVGYFAGADSNKDKHQSVVDFNDDNSEMNIIVVQEQSGKEGISLHDKTGKHQRVMMSLALPQSPITFIQSEGRIFRIGNGSNAIFEYPILGIANEIGLWAQRFNGRAGTTENLALGSQARGLKVAINRGLIEHQGNVEIGDNTQGFGGKDFDARATDKKTPYDQAIDDFEAEEKVRGDKERDNTPEPLGYKMAAEWAEAEPGETMLEPSAGEGSIARYFPSFARTLAVEPNGEKYSRLALLTGGVPQGSTEAKGKKHLLRNGNFEDLNSGANKADIIILNSSDDLQASHFKKAVNHLNNSGRIILRVAKDIGDYGFNEMKKLYPNLVPVAYIKFNREQTNGIDGLVVMDKVERKEMRDKMPKMETIDLSDAKDQKELFEKLRDVKVPKRTIDPVAKYQKKAEVLRQSLATNVGIRKSKGARSNDIWIGNNDITIYTSSKAGNRQFAYWQQTGPHEGYKSYYQLNFTDIARLNGDIPRMYKAMAEALEMGEQEFMDNVFNSWGKKGDPDAVKGIFKAITKLIRDISGKTDDQIKRYANGEDIFTKAKVTSGDPLPLKRVRQLFEETNTGDNKEEMQYLFDKVMNTAEKIGLADGRVYNNKEDATSSGVYVPWDNAFHINADAWNSKNATDKSRANTLLHEMTHAVTNYAIWRYENGYDLPEPLREAVEELKSLREAVRRSQGSWKLNHIKNGYMWENLDEFTAEASSNPDVRETMKQMGLWTRFKDAIKKFFHWGAMDPELAKETGLEQTNALTEFDRIMDKFLDNFDKKSYDDYVKIAKMSKGMNNVKELKDAHVDYNKEGEEALGEKAKLESGDDVGRSQVNDTVDDNGKIVKGLRTYLKELNSSLKNENSSKTIRRISSEIKRVEDEISERRKRTKELRRELDATERGVVNQTKIEELFKKYLNDSGENTKSDLGNLFHKVAQKCHDLGIKFEVVDEHSSSGESFYSGNIILNLDTLSMSGVSNEEKASLILHEMIHQGSQSTITAWNYKDRFGDYPYRKDLTPQQVEFAKEVNRIFEEVEKHKGEFLDLDGNPMYEFKNAKDMLAGLARVKYREALDNIKINGKGVVQRIKEAIKKLFFGEDIRESALQKLTPLLNDIIDGTTKKTFENTRGHWETNNDKIIATQRKDKEYEEAVKSGDVEKAKEMLREEADRKLNTMILPNDDDVEGFKYHRGEAPKKTFKRYAVLNVTPDGFKAAYAGNGVGTPIGVWLDAQNLQSYMSDKVKFDDGTYATYIKGDTGANAASKFSKEKMDEYGIKGSDRLLLERGGKHSSDVPNFSQMNLKQNEEGEKVTSPKDGALPHNKLIFEIEYGMGENGDITDYVKENGRMSKGHNQGLAKIEPNQYYDFKTNPNAVGKWGIGGTFRITRLVPHDEVVSVTEQYKKDAIAEAERAFNAGEISKKDYEAQLKNANAIQVQKWVGGYHPEDFGLTPENVDEMRQEGEKKKVMDITYDDNGKLIPLSKRFDSKVNDLRYRTSEPSMAQRREAPAVVRKAAADAINALGGKGHIHKDYEHLPYEGRVALDKNPNAMGWYNKETGEVHIYLPNCPTAVEAERTVLHEKVGHEGLRKVVGEENYKKFLMSVWEGVGSTARHEIQELASRNGMNYHVAVDEWLAKRAEDFDMENDRVKRSTWQKIKDLWNEMMHKLGFKHGMSEKDIRKALWLSKHALDNKPGNFDYTAGKTSFEDKLKRYSPSESVSKDGKNWDDDADGETISDRNAIIYRTMTDKDREKYEEGLTPTERSAKWEYEDDLKNVSFLWTEAHQNAGRSLQLAYQEIAGRHGTWDDADDCFKQLNQLGSKNQQEMKEFTRIYADGMTRSLAHAMPYFDGKNSKERLQNLEHYVYAKHALERNRVIAVRDYCKTLAKTPTPQGATITNADKAEAFQSDFDTLRESLYGQLESGTITLRDYYKQLDDFINTEIKDWDAGKNDLSGLSDTETFTWGTGKKGEYDDAKVIDHVMNCEAKMGKDVTDRLWSDINATSQFVRDKDYDCGLNNSRAKRRMETMFSWYVPLRGFNATTADQMYYYMHDKGNVVGSAAKKMEGRISASDSPIATLLAMGSYSILKGNRNKAKQALVRFVRKNPNNLITQMEAQYLKTTDGFGNDVLEALYPDFNENMTADEVEQAIQQFKADIEARKANGEKIVTLKDMKTGVPYRIVRNSQKEQHLIHTMINGKDVTLIIHGNPRAAQFVNGDISNYRVPIISWLNSLESQLATSKSLTFMARNAVRDWNYATSTIAATEGWKYNVHFHYMMSVLNGKAALNALPGAVTGVADTAKKIANRLKNGEFAEPVVEKHGCLNSMRNLFVKYKQGTLDTSNEVERYFKEFCDNGGMTGFVQLQGVDDYKQQIDDALKKFNRGKLGKTLHAVGQVPNVVTLGLIKNYFKIVEAVNESVENQARFCTYYASRKAKRNIIRSIDDAKNISVNFNKTGAGSATMKLRKMGDASLWYRTNAILAGASATFLKNSIWFYNAGVQGMSRSYQIAMGEGVKEKNFVSGLKKAMGTNQFYRAFGTFCAIPFGAGMLMAFLNEQMAASDDDEDRKKYGDNPYLQLPEYERRDNVCFYLGKGRFMKIPLAIETRAMYAMGDLAAGIYYPELLGEKPIAEQVLQNVAQMTPTDILGGAKVGWNDVRGTILGAITPSAVQPVVAMGSNIGWTGTPISYVSDWNSKDPKWKHANPRTYEGYIKTAKNLSKKTGGDDIKPGAIDLDPSKLEYLFNAYASGPGKDINEIMTFYAQSTEEDTTGKHGNKASQEGRLPIVKAFYRGASPANSLNTDRTRWYAYLKENGPETYYEGKYEKAGRDVDTSARLASGDPELKIAYVVKRYQKRIKKLETRKNKAKTRADKEFFQDHINETIHDAIERIDKIKDGSATSR